MQRNPFPPGGVVFLILAVLLAACSAQTPAASQAPAAASLVPTQAPSIPPAAPSSTVVPAAFTDPFSYCAAVGTIDTPDARYTGVKVPDEVIAGFKKAAGLEASTEPLDMFRQTTIWRCMDGRVYACNFGANLPCDSKANADKTPSPEIVDYCKANPASDFIPMSVTGHDTIYSWRCASGAPEVLEQITTVDPQGYLGNIWYAIEPGASGTPSPAGS